MEQAMTSCKRVVFELTHPHAAGIDIGAPSHFVAVPPDRDDQPVQEFPSFTEDLERLAAWLTACGVDTVAMESTGVYWIPLFELLEARGFTVYLVNARHVKNVPGRKSDVLDCQWLQQLMSFGLLRGAFRPQGDVCALHAVARQRAMLPRYQARHIQHMQKALTQMNIQLGQVISDVAGETGQKIIRAILTGERDGATLAKLRNVRIRAGEEEITKALQGNWREEHLFALRQAVALYDAYAGQLSECDRQLETMLEALAQHAGEPGKPKRRSKAKNAPKFDLRSHLFKLCGVDLTRIGHRRDHRLHGAGGSRRRPVALQGCQAFRFLAGLVSGHQNFRRQGVVGQIQAHCQPRSASLEIGGGCPAYQSIGLGSLLSAALRPHGQASGRYRLRS
jgi:transposase